MRMLAIECATEACSLALFDGERLIDSRHEILGRGHAEHLVPLIASLPGKGRAEVLRVSLGPGSFTGVRIGLAAARSLALAWGASVQGYPTLPLVATQASRREQRPVTVCMNGGHGEWFVQNFAEQCAPQDEVRSLAPEAAVRAARHPTVAGNRARELVELDGGGGRVAVDMLPDARFALDLPARFLSDLLTPIYGRGPDARLPK